MQQLKIDDKGTDLYAVKAPHITQEFWFDKDHFNYLLIPKEFGLDERIKKIKLPEGNWELLGEVTKDSIGFDCDPYLVYYAFNGYKNYNSDLEHDYFDGHEPQQSFYSLLAANGICFENPIEKPDLKYSDYEFGDGGLSESMQKSIENDFDQVFKWQSYESKLVEKVIIIKKVK